MFKMICKICGKPLKTIKSRELGYGPSCYKKRKKKIADEEFEKNQITIYHVLGELK